MSKLFNEAKNIIGLERDLNLNDYKKFIEIEKNITEDEEDKFAWLSEALEIRLPEIAQNEGNYDWIEPDS
jgi:hypothetical protein